MNDFANFYRPLHLKEFIGPSVFPELLTGIASGKTKQRVFIFHSSGSGVGKTTAARLLALSVNCLNQVNKTGDPCGECKNCSNIRNKKASDIIELNFANERGIDSARDLIEQARLKPIDLKYRIIIIDEAHQATKPAQESLLKLLEEPPPHLYIILCTTNKQALIPTILTRCVQIEFPIIKAEDIYQKLLSVCSKENIEIKDKEALKYLSENCSGSVRQAFKYLEQLTTDFTLDTAKKIIGVPEEDMVKNFINAMKNSDIITVVKYLRVVNIQQMNVQEFIKNCIQHATKRFEETNFELYLTIIKELTIALESYTNYGSYHKYIIEETRRVKNLPSPPNLERFIFVAKKINAVLIITTDKQVIFDFSGTKVALKLRDTVDAIYPFFMEKDTIQTIINDKRDSINFIALQVGQMIQKNLKITFDAN